MSYTPTNWQTGDTITAAKLNKLEQAVENAGGKGLLVTITEDGNNLVMDKTYREIFEAVTTGVPVSFIQINSGQK